MIKILETPRDALQGISKFIPTEQKIKYINSLLDVGFDMLDFGSFVSPKAIPQLKDSAEVIEQLNENNNTKIIATIGSFSGAQRAFKHGKIDAVAFPFSISEIFLKKNINSNFNKSQLTIDNILNLCEQKNKSLKLYIAMAFGNPYGDKWSPDLLAHWIDKLLNMGVKEILLADTTGDGHIRDIADSFTLINKEFPNLNPSAHLHTLPNNWEEKLSAAYENGCRSFDSVLGGFGGCPMSGKALMGNLDTANLLSFAKKYGEETKVNQEALFKAYEIGNTIFNT
ncbi:MAG: hydroxymethylglutaryl-CoA lyase [Bacteroidetes bacterium]|nr:MAG: hydroxymethylglutaryl-CoA lyase [Bacteroidota bacterium]